MAEIVHLVLIRYLRNIIMLTLFCGTLYLVFWVWKKSAWHHLKIAKTNIKSKPAKEAVYSFLNLALYLIPVVIAYLLEKNFAYSVRYENIGERGWLYFFFSIGFMLVVQDSYFYWVHRWLHSGKMRIHRTHHQFINPTPWAAYSFHLAEGALIVVPFTAFILFLPWHPASMLSFSLIALFTNSFLHLGYDPIPQSWRSHFLLKWITTPSHHCGHHHNFNGNFGLYFMFWDRILKTEIKK
jgi:Delta7-sterol 5-desaturase